MARSGKGRGTRMGRGVLSGTTLATKPSGVTMDAGGIDFGNGMLRMSGGSVTWAGTSIVVDTGLTTIVSFDCVLGRISGASMASCRYLECGDGGSVTAALISVDSTGSLEFPYSGGSLCWIAFGT